MTTSSAPVPLLERLTPTERAAYVLREAFGYAYADIVRIVQLSQAAARQLVSRARKHIATGKRTTVVASRRRALLEAFVTAARIGDLAGLEHLFAEDVVCRADSGGVVRPAARVPVVGRRKFALWQMNPAKLEPVRRTAGAARRQPAGSNGMPAGFMRPSQ